MTLFPADVPIHRDSVGAMTAGGITPDPRPFRPYVYRGTGEDQFPETEPVKKPKPKRKRKWTQAQAFAARDRRIAKRKREAELIEARAKRREELIERAMTHGQPEPKPLDIMDTSTWGNFPKPPEPEPVRSSPARIRPASGWKPLAGADLDALLEEDDAH